MTCVSRMPKNNAYTDAWWSIAHAREIFQPLGQLSDRLWSLITFLRSSARRFTHRKYRYKWIARHDLYKCRTVKSKKKKIHFSGWVFLIESCLKMSYLYLPLIQILISYQFFFYFCITLLSDFLCLSILYIK